MNDKGNIILYTTPDGEAKIEVTLQDETVWLTLDQMAELFQRNKSTISRHIKNIFETGELNADSTVAFFATVQTEGKRKVERNLAFYNLDMMKDSAGGQAGIPVSMTGRIFYWDKTTFDEAGIDVPTSLAELREAGKTFQEVLGDDYFPLALGEFDRAILMTFYLQAKYGKPIISDRTLNFTVEELQDGLDFIQSLEADHVILINCNQGAYGFPKRNQVRASAQSAVPPEEFPDDLTAG